MPQKNKAVRARPPAEIRLIARAIAMNDRDKSDDGRRPDQRGNEPLFEPIEKEVEQPQYSQAQSLTCSEEGPSVF